MRGAVRAILATELRLSAFAIIRRATPESAGTLRAIAWPSPSATVSKKCRLLTNSPSVILKIPPTAFGLSIASRHRVGEITDETVVLRACFTARDVHDAAVPRVASADARQHGAVARAVDEPRPQDRDRHRLLAVILPREPFRLDLGLRVAVDVACPAAVPFVGSLVRCRAS